MTKRQTRLFFVVGTSVFAAIFTGLTIDSHLRFAELTHAEAITTQVVAGKHVWHRKNCINCHTLLGEGAYYAPDLTKITQQRGDAYLRQFLQDPSRFYSEQRHGRVQVTGDGGGLPTCGRADRDLFYHPRRSIIRTYTHACHRRWNDGRRERSLR